MSVIFFVAFYFVLTNYYSDIQINKYDSLETVKKQQAIEHGWVPQRLPLSAYNIVETHDVDSNIVFGKFAYKERDEANFLEGLKESNNTYIGEKFLFKIDKKLNLVDFRNR
jgi:hypothetical protein